MAMLLYKIIPLLVLYMACHDDTIWCDSYTMDQIFQQRNADIMSQAITMLTICIIMVCTI